MLRGVKRLPGGKPPKPPRDRIIMVRLARPKHVTLPNGRSFKARFRRATCDELPHNVNFPRKYTQGAAPKGKRRRQRGRVLKACSVKHSV